MSNDKNEHKPLYMYNIIFRLNWHKRLCNYDAEGLLLDSRSNMVGLFTMLLVNYVAAFEIIFSSS